MTQYITTFEKIRKIDPILKKKKKKKLGKAGCGGTCLLSQHLGCRGRSIKFQASLKHIVRTLTPKPQTKIRLSICISGCLQLSLYKGFQTPNETTGVNPAINPGVCIILPIYSGLILVIPQSSNSTISEQYSSDLTMSELSREIL